MGGNVYSDGWGKVDETVEEVPEIDHKAPSPKVEVVDKPNETEIPE